MNIKYWIAKQEYKMDKFMLKHDTNATVIIATVIVLMATAYIIHKASH